ncbi:MAG: DUF898 family protein [Flavobacteriia bacterium]|nr:DUF898 family protein [Flavobacteriia bacterium]
MDSNSSIKIRFSFLGTGGELFKILLLNWILTVLTLGIYYPWAKEKYLKYLYNSSQFNNDPFRFHGTGKEMFIGMIKALVLVILFYGIFYLLLINGQIIALLVFFYAGLFFIVPLAIHGSYRYRLSRSSWRNIRFRYSGNKTILMLNFLKWVILTIVTLGIYTSWFKCNLRKYLYDNIYFGNVRFRYVGNGEDLFVINFKGIVFSFLTFGIYSFWWKKDQFNFYVNNIRIEQDGKISKLQSNLDAGEVFELIVINYLMMVFTFGIAYPWVVSRSLKKLYSLMYVVGEVDFDGLAQNTENYNDALGDDVADFLDIDFFI